MEERIVGLETEYGLSVKMEDGSFVHPPYAGKYFLEPLEGLLAEQKNNRHPFLEKAGIVRIVGEKLVSGPTFRFWIAASGGKLYRDTIGPADILEYATPECITIRDLVRAEQGGDRLVYELSKILFPIGENASSVVITRTNWDAINGNSLSEIKHWGNHENYQVKDDFLSVYAMRGRGSAYLMKLLNTLLVTRIVLTGLGGLLYDRTNTTWRYVVSPRAFSSRLPLFTFRGGKIGNSGDFHDCPEGFARLHVFSGDPLMLPKATQIRFGLVSVFLRMCEAGVLEEYSLPVLEEPEKAFPFFSRDSSLRRRASLYGKNVSWTAVQILKEWAECLSRFIESRRVEVPLEERQIVERVLRLCDVAERDSFLLYPYADWMLKRTLLEQYCRKKKIDFGDSRARFFDVLYSDISPAGIYHRWRSAQKKSPLLFSEEEMDRTLLQHQAAPRAELRKKHLRALDRAGEGTRNEWGKFFSFPKKDFYLVRDPLCGTHTGIEEEIEYLKKTSEKKCADK